MGVWASAAFTLGHPDGTEERVEVEVSTDAGYSPDLASDLMARARAGLAEAYAQTWPVEAPPA